MRGIQIAVSLVLLGVGLSRAEETWALEREGDTPYLQILCDGKLVTRYHFKDVPRPFFYPVIAPWGEAMTRGYPMEPSDDEARDHPHHRSLWMGHLDVNGVNFWTEPVSHKNPPEGMRFGTIQHTGFGSLNAGEGELVITAHNDWLDPDGKVLLSDKRVYTFRKDARGRLRLDWDVTFEASEGDVVFGDDKDGLMAIRVVPGLRLEPKDDGAESTGRILTSEGVEGRGAWGKRAKWVTYAGVDRGGKACGVALFDHPQNLRHPTWFHARHYGLLTANPFGIHHFEKKARGEGDFRLAEGETLRQRYRLLFYQGEPDAAALDEVARQFGEAK